MEHRCLLVIRIRGRINVPKGVRDTLHMLRLRRKNTATLIDDRPSYRGMLQTAKDWITWGEPTLKTIRMLLERRGEKVGGGPIDGETLEALGYGSLEELAEDLHSCRAEFHRLKGVKPFFRLHSPSGGFKGSIKRPYRAGGELGYRGEAINELAERMS
ncbi:MAG: 50S ribosomal protein L30 [Candidatus Bathyarchaeota archaeon B23]|nr:MAG: 50S ribosomal protein L30 [Candidatus Bathyarchaeota archaeon B23]